MRNDLELRNDWIRISVRRSGNVVSHAIGSLEGSVIAQSLDTHWSDVRRDGNTLVFDGKTALGPASLTLEVPSSGSWVQGTFDAVVTGRLSELLVLYEFCREKLDFAFAPHIRPGDDQSVAQWGMKTPAAIVQAGTATMALALNTDMVTEQSRTLPLALEMEADPLAREHPLLGIGVKLTVPVDLNYFRASPDLGVELRDERIRFGFYIWVSDAQAPGQGYRAVSHWLWQIMGAKRVKETVAPQVANFEHYAESGLKYAFDNLWSEFDAASGPAGAVLNGIVYPNDVWFQSLFDHMRSAIGLWGFGYPERARRIKNLALSAPGHPAGPYKTIYHTSVRQARREQTWVTSSHWMLSGGVESKMRSVRKQNLVKLLDWENLYHSVDCSWNAYWMLRWHTEVESDERLVTFASRYADFLLREQTVSGAIPSFFRDNGEGLSPDPLLSHNVGTAASGALLAMLHTVTGKAEYLHAAIRAARFVEKDVLPEHRWQDYEVVFDSGAKPLGFYDRHTHQYAQTTQGMVWTIAMFHALYRTTGRHSFLERAAEVVDYLSLFQQLWDPPFLSVRTFGGFPVGNSHPSWNDARTPLLATAFADHFALTAEPEYLERAVAALRASLVLMFMPENNAVSGIFADGPFGHADEGYAGRGRDEQFTGLSFDFPVGAALSSITLVKRRFGDVYVDASRGFGLGIDGSLVRKVRVDAAAVEIVVESGVPLLPGSTARIVVAQAPAERTELVINSERVGTFSREQLEGGIHFAWVSPKVLAFAGLAP